MCPVEKSFKSIKSIFLKKRFHWIAFCGALKFLKIISKWMNGSRRAAGQLSSLPSNWIDELFDDVVLYWTFSSHLIISALFKHQIYAQIKQFSFFFWKLFKFFFHFQIFYEIVHQVRTRFCWNWQIIFFLYSENSVLAPWRHWAVNHGRPLSIKRSPTAV